MKRIEAPKHLTAEARAIWARLRAEHAIDDRGGLLILQSALEAFDRVQEARRIIATEGAVTHDRFGQARAHPAVGIERDARNQMHGALRLLKLSPETCQ